METECLTEILLFRKMVQRWMDKVKREYRSRNDKGDAYMIAYQIFPGIEIMYNSIHTDRCHLGGSNEGEFIEIHHCMEGRMEQHQEGVFFYLMPGDLSISRKKRYPCEYSFPLRHYHGITILIDMATAPECFSCFLEDVDISPAEVSKRLCGRDDCFVLRSQNYIEHIFSEVYPLFEKNVYPGKNRAQKGAAKEADLESCQKGYLKVKVLELLIVLNGISPEENSVSFLALSKAQTDLAKKAADYLVAHMDEQVKVRDLAARFYVSQTHIQNVFKGVYGVPVQSYIRILKMQAAASMLVYTDLSVLEIASRSGYDNSSKFAHAFRKIMGETPVEYRKMHGKQ